MLVLGLCLFTSHGVVAQSDLTISKLQAANSAIEVAYQAVLDAESDGADVSGLLVGLNNGAELLSKARMAFDIADFDEILGYVESASEVGNEIVIESELLKIEAVNARDLNSWTLLVISAIGVLVVAVASVLGYRLFKNHYYKQLSKKKPRIELA